MRIHIIRQDHLVDYIAHSHNLVQYSIPTSPAWKLIVWLECRSNVFHHNSLSGELLIQLQSLLVKSFGLKGVRQNVPGLVSILENKMTLSVQSNMSHSAHIELTRMMMTYLYCTLEDAKLVAENDTLDNKLGGYIKYSKFLFLTFTYSPFS